MQQKGYIQLYTGNGKGKTTAALGLALRAAGAGMKSIVIQFMKGQHYNELESVKRLDGLIIIEQYGSEDFCNVDDKNLSQHYNLARNGYNRAMEVISNNRFPIVILDEIITAHLFKLVTLDDILNLIKLKHDNTELILTGRGAPKELIERCDLVTEMKEIRHYYNDGVTARVGIEH